MKFVKLKLFQFYKNHSVNIKQNKLNISSDEDLKYFYQLIVSIIIFEIQEHFLKENVKQF